MRELPYAGRDGFQLKIFYIPEKQCAYIQRKAKFLKTHAGDCHPFQRRLQPRAWTVHRYFPDQIPQFSPLNSQQEGGIP